MKKKVSAVKRSVKPKPRTAKRNTVDGTFGDGAKAADKLVRRIVNIFNEEFDPYPPISIDVTGAGTAVWKRIKAELLAATTVVERQERAIGAGVVYVMSDGKPQTYYGEVTVHVDRFDPALPANKHFKYVHLIPAHPPKPAKAVGRKGGR